MDTIRLCETCGKPLAPDSPQGFCAECLLQAGFPTDSGEATARPGAFVPQPIEAIAELFPQLEILGLLGHGGMGAVYKARQPGLDRLVALKILPPQVGTQPGFADRFTREARALARLSHPNIVAVYDFGQADLSGAGVASGNTGNPSAAARLHYFIMEYVDGPNLRQLERAGKLSPRQALQIIPQICEALQFAHDEGIVHRDIKPENVLLDRRGRVKIADFGLAKLLGSEAESGRLTGEGHVMGTPHYMAPEQVEHPLAVDHRADIYSLGVVFYEMLTGELPLGKFQPPSRRIQVDARLDEVVLRALEKEPERRYQSASQVKSAVEAISTRAAAPAPAVPCASTPPRAPRHVPRWFWYLAALLAALVVAVFAFRKPLGRETPRAAPAAGPASAVAELKTFSTADRPISGDLALSDGAWVATCSGPQTLPLFEVATRGVENCCVVYQARLKSEGLAGRAYLEMWCQVPGIGRAFSRGLDNVLTGSNDWATYQTPFFLKAGERPDLIQLNVVVEGKGRVFIKDVKVFTSPLPAGQNP